MPSWKPKRRKRPRGRVAFQRLTHEERLRVTTSRQWVAGYPRLLAEWHPTKNGDLYPFQVSFGSMKRVWWQCPVATDHLWQAQAGERTRGERAGGGGGCPFCAGHKPSSTNNLALTGLDIVEQWHPTRNGALTPRDVTRGSSRVVWWRCVEGPDHEWQAPISARTYQTRCPFCVGLKVSVTNSLASLHPDLAKQWHPTRNGRLGPASVTARSRRRVWWRCARDATHEWQTSVANRTAAAATNCPMCVGKKPSLERSLATRFPDLAREWHPTRNGTLRPTEVTYGSKRDVWWQCAAVPSHVWRTSVNSRSGGTGCPRCARVAQRSSRKPTPERTLAARFPEVAREWHPTRNGTLLPTDVSFGSKRIVWWQCQAKRSHVWAASVNTRTAMNGTHCPDCARARRAERARGKSGRWT